MIGEREEAKEIFEKMISYSNHVGLYSEDLDFKTKRQLGNFPQAYSHLAFINTAVLFSEEKQLSRFIRPECLSRIAGGASPVFWQMSRDNMC